jgi:hypothetical protein
MHRQRTILGASLLALLVSLSFASAAVADCKEVLATSGTAWVEESGGEVGEVRGHINGSMFLSYQDEPSFDLKRGEGPNLVIVTQEGELRLWVSGKSFQREDGSWTRSLTTDRAEGTGAWAKHGIFLDFEGTFVTDQGGNYQISGKICPPGEY